jgi:TetR/AcrR family transcriptional regulator, tetracycline repressor protein
VSAATTKRGGALRPLTRDRIVDESLAIVDEVGLDALTLRGLGDRLGTDPTAVYRHFRDKADLVQAISERLLDSITDGIDTEAPWGDVVVAVCARLRAELLQHPDLARAVQFGPPLQASEFAITELVLAQLRRAGLDLSTAALTYHAVIELTIGSAAIDAPLHALEPKERSNQYFRWRSVYATLDPAEYPVSVDAAPHLYRGTADDRFEFAVRRLLDGVSAAH